MSFEAHQDTLFQVLVNGTSFDVAFDGGQCKLNGRNVSYFFEPIGDQTYALWIDGSCFPVVIQRAESAGFRITIHGHMMDVQVKNETDLLLERLGLNDSSSSALKEVHAPMPGLVLSVLVEVGQKVDVQTGLVVLEAMKMENELRATSAGVVRAIHVSPGESVLKNALLIEFES